MLNPFAIIPPKFRAALYLAYGVAGIALGVCAIWGVENVDKFGASLVVIGTALGFTAASNTNLSPDEPVTASLIDARIVEEAGVARFVSGKIKLDAETIE